MEPQGSSEPQIRCFFLNTPFHKAFHSTPDTRAQPTAPHRVRTHPSCKPCASSDVPARWLQPDPTPGQDGGTWGKRGHSTERESSWQQEGEFLSIAVQRLGRRARRQWWEALPLEVVKVSPIKTTVGTEQTSNNT